MLNQDWSLLTTFFPYNWQELAATSGAIKGLRQDKSVEDLLRVLLLHFACGYSLRETVVRAKAANLASMSDVALLKRLRKCKEWLRSLCTSLFAERGIMHNRGVQFRILDATHVKEPGKTGSQWRIHYSFQVPQMKCDFFKITKTEGKNTGEDLNRFTINAGDHIIVDRGYSRATGIAYVAKQGAFVCVRVNHHSLRFMYKNKEFLLMKNLKRLEKPLAVASWEADVVTADGIRVTGRICAIKKTEEATKKAVKKAKREASKARVKIKESTLFLAGYIVLFTTFPERKFSPEQVLEWYRIRWQIELIFKRFKQITHLGHLPKYHDDSAQTWLYGKLFIALLTEKIIQHAGTISPWGKEICLQCLAQLSIYVPSSQASYNTSYVFT